MAYNSNFGCNIRLLLCCDLIDPTIYIHKKVRFPLLEQKRNKDYISCMNNIYINCRREAIGGFQCHYLLYIMHHT